MPELVSPMCIDTVGKKKFPGEKRNNKQRKINAKIIYTCVCFYVYKMIALS